MIRLAAGDRALFASDMHMGGHAPDTVDAFLAALDAHARDATHLFLLGDLFEVWVGDDWAEPVCAQALAHLRTLTERGLALFVMRGNRDFLLDVPLPSPSRCRSFSARVGATMLDDPTLIDLFGARAVLVHGDALCTDDLDYQRFRALTRTAAWRNDFLARPLEQRIAVADDLRMRSEQAKGDKSTALMDAAPDAVAQTMAAASARLLIHGHTHRPACHRLQIDGQAATRWVLPDWDAADGRGGLLRVSAAGFEALGHWPEAISPPSG